MAAEGNVHQEETAEHLSPRLRIERLLDPASAFLEIGRPPANHEPDSAPIVGIGRVAGRLVVAVAEGKGKAAPAKIHRAQEIARRGFLPLLYLLEGGLAASDSLLLQQQARLAAAGMPAITVFFAAPTPAGVQLAALTDETIVTGAAAMADRVALDDAHALFLLRQVVGLLPAPALPSLPGPAFPPQTLAPTTDLLAHVLDEGYLPRFRPESPCPLGFAHVGGLPLGVMAHTTGALPDAALADMAAFLQLCARRRLPLLEIGTFSPSAPASNTQARAQAAVQKAWATFSASSAAWITLLREGTPRPAATLAGNGPRFCWMLEDRPPKDRAPEDKIPADSKSTAETLSDGFLALEEARMVVALLLAASHPKGGNPG